MKRMSENPKVREWWAMTDGMQVSFVTPLQFNAFICSADPWCRKVLFLVL